MNNPDDPRTWIAKAESDLLNIRNSLRAEQVPWDTICTLVRGSFLALKAIQVGRAHPALDRANPS